METITTIQRHECLPFAELDADVQEKVLQEYGDWNVDHDWWAVTYDVFANTCKEDYGIDVNLKATYFSGFSFQGDDAAFTGRLTDIDLFLERANCPTEFWRVLRYMVNEMYLRPFTEPRGFYNTSQFSDFDRYNINPHENEDNQQDHYEHAEKALDWLENAWESACIDLASVLYNSLEREYDYLTGVEALSETFDATECLFDIKTGELFYKEQNAA